MKRFLMMLYTVLASILFTFPAHAHVKWFAPYIVAASPQSIQYTLTDSWFWLGLLLVTIFFLVTRAIETTPMGDQALDLLDKATNPLWKRLDDFVRIVIAAFFVAIFAVGGVYLTPDLQTSSEWVSWSQLVIAGLIFSRRTQPLAAIGIVGLWVLALRDYPLFHMLDYLALGVGVAAYLWLEASGNEQWRAQRFTALRIGVAIALMWSSLEKFAYPDWFYPLVDERPYLTFGMARDAFIPMAGLAEFTMGFGLLWTPLIRHLSAIALFIIFTAAVYPFGRMDLVGHALIMAIIVAIVADHSRDIGIAPALKSKVAIVPAALASILVIFFAAYWGIHLMIYGANSTGEKPAIIATHSFDPDHPHPTVDSQITHIQAYNTAMDDMHGPMMAGIAHNDPDAAFVLGMVPHHQGAIDMAKIQLRFGKDARMRDLARRILMTQHDEIKEMNTWLKQHGHSITPENPENPENAVTDPHAGHH